MEKDDIIKYWIKSADQDYRTMNNLFTSRDYTWSLFVGHLVIEKLLKACYVTNVDENVPRVHNLLRVAEKAGIALPDEQKDQLLTITTFNLNARYDSYKQEFRKRSNKAYAATWIKHIKELRKWIKKEHLN